MVSVDVKHHAYLLTLSRLSLISLMVSVDVKHHVYLHCLVTLTLTVNETLKRLSSLPILQQESFWW